MMYDVVARHTKESVAVSFETLLRINRQSATSIRQRLSKVTHRKWRRRSRSIRLPAAATTKFRFFFRTVRQGRNQVAHRRSAALVRTTGPRMNIDHVVLHAAARGHPHSTVGDQSTIE